MPTESHRPTRWEAATPQFAYSESREGSFRRCQRAHYHATYTAWRGWSAPVGSDAWLAYRLKKATPLAAALGSVVHDAATRCVRAVLAARRLPTLHELRREAGDALNAIWANSRTGRQAFLRRPSNLPTPMLQEILYGEQPTPEMLARARAKLDRTLGNLLACDQLWTDVAAAGPSGVITVDRFYQFELAPGGLVVYAAPDLVLVAPGMRPVIVDFKTSGADGVIDQILTYALAARDGLRLDVSDGCVGQVVALDAAPGDRVNCFPIFPEEIDAAAERIRANVARMHALLVDVPTNTPLPLDAYPQTANQRGCRGCTYRALCWPEHRIAGMPDDRPAAHTVLALAGA